MKLDDAAAHLEALGNPTRLKIYRALVRAGETGMPVGKLQDRLKIAPSTLSHHIKTLVTPWALSHRCGAKDDHAWSAMRQLFDHMRDLVDFLVAGMLRRRRRGSPLSESKTAAVVFADREFGIFCSWNRRKGMSDAKTVAIIGKPGCRQPCRLLRHMASSAA